jgi:hypothetical protein
MASSIVVGIIVFLVSYLVVLGAPLDGIGLIIVIGVLIKYFFLYTGLTAVMIAVSTSMPARWAYAISTAIAAAGFVMAYTLPRSDDPIVHLRLAMFVAGTTTISVMAVRSSQKRIEANDQDKA